MQERLILLGSKLPLRRLVVCCTIIVHGCNGDAGVDYTDVGDLSLFELEEELRVGSRAGGEAGFTDIGDIAIDTFGFVYILEASDLEVRVFDSSGVFMRAIGREGRGPGEFQVAERLGLIGDTLWVSDQSGRMTLFDRAGAVLATYNPAPIDVRSLPGGVHASLIPGELGGDGLIVSMPRMSIMVSAANYGISFSIPDVRMERSGRVIDTLRLQEFVLPEAQGRTSMGGRAISIPHPPSSTTLTVATDGGSYRVDRAVANRASDGEFTVTRLRGLADTVFSRRYRYTPQGYTSARIDNLIAPAIRVYLRQAGPGADSGGAAAALRRALDLPPFQPPVSAGRVGEDGTLWLRREDHGGATIEWIMIRPDGDPLGNLEIPRNATVHWSSDSVVWASVTDGLDVPWLTRYHLRVAR